MAGLGAALLPTVPYQRRGLGGRGRRISAARHSCGRVRRPARLRAGRAAGTSRRSRSRPSPPRHVIGVGRVAVDDEPEWVESAVDDQAPVVGGTALEHGRLSTRPRWLRRADGLAAPRPDRAQPPATTRRSGTGWPEEGCSPALRRGCDGHAPSFGEAIGRRRRRGRADDRRGLLRQAEARTSLCGTATLRSRRGLADASRRPIRTGAARLATLQEVHRGTSSATFARPSPCAPAANSSLGAGRLPARPRPVANNKDTLPRT